MSFRIGQKVVCIKRGAWVWDTGELTVGPTYGQILTIREIRPDDDYDDHVGCLLFEEFHSTEVDDYGDEIGSNRLRFRPAVEHKTDISVFTAMLNPKGVEEKV